MQIYIATQVGTHRIGEALDAESAAALVDQLGAAYLEYQKRLAELGPTLTPKLSEHFDYVEGAEIVAYDDEGDVYFYEVQDGVGYFINYSEKNRQEQAQEQSDGGSP